MVANRMARESLVGPSHAAVALGVPDESSRWMASPCDDGVVDQEAERNDETCYGDLL
jgi:hypothetical protein